LQHRKKTEEENEKSEVTMKKRIVILGVTVVTALSAIGSASAAMWNRYYGSNNNAPAAQCGAGDTACKLSTAQAAPLTNSPSQYSSSHSAGSGYNVK
jgi:flagellar basal body-associated protein FliL